MEQMVLRINPDHSTYLNGVLTSNDLAHHFSTLLLRDDYMSNLSFSLSR
jgi:hypothetical protein